MTDADLQFLNRLESIIDDRVRNATSESYTARLIEAGPKRIAQKVGEEGVELALAAAAGDRAEVLEEAADLGDGVTAQAVAFVVLTDHDPD